MELTLMILALLPTLALGKAKSLRVPSSEALACQLKGGNGPFKSFKMREGTLSFEMADTREKVDSLPLKAEKYGNDRIKAFSFEIFDQGDGNIFVTSDDDGKAAFAEYTSDGPRETGYYRCK